MFIQQRMFKQKFNLLACKSTARNLIKAVLRIWSRMFLGLLDPDPDPLVRGTDPDPAPSIIKQKQ
jgi:hypothetical protein